MSTKLDKALTCNMKTIIRRALEDKFKNEECPWIADYDTDEGYVVYEYWRCGEGYKNYKLSATFNGNTVTFVGDPVEVICMTSYAEVQKESDLDKSLTDKVVGILDKYFGGSKQTNIPVIKSLNEDEMIAIEQLYIHVDGVDGVGDIYSSPDVMVEMVESFNKAIEDGKLKANYFHKYNTEDFVVNKAWIVEEDTKIGETLIKAGTPLVENQFKNAKAWELRKSGQICGVSIGATATWEEV